MRGHAEVAFFLTLGIGYVLGKLRLGGFSLGPVTGTLRAGVLVGQLGVKVSPEVKQCFFVLFLFAIGYRCGPQFFQGLRRDGLSQAAVAAVVATTGLVVAYVISLAFKYDGGTGAGLIAGALTESATIGTAGDAIARLPIDEAARTAMANRIPVAFAVTYLIGVVGAPWFLAQIGPRLMGVDLARACAEYKATMGGGAKHPPVTTRALGFGEAWSNTSFPAMKFWSEMFDVVASRPPTLTDAPCPNSTPCSRATLGRWPSGCPGCRMRPAPAPC